MKMLWNSPIQPITKLPFALLLPHKFLPYIGTARKTWPVELFYLWTFSCFCLFSVLLETVAADLALHTTCKSYNRNIDGIPESHSLHRGDFSRLVLRKLEIFARTREPRPSVSIDFYVITKGVRRLWERPLEKLIRTTGNPQPRYCHSSIALLKRCVYQCHTILFQLRFVAV